MLSPIQLLKSALILFLCSRQSNRSDFSVCLMPPLKPKVYLQLSSITPFRGQADCIEVHLPKEVENISINEKITVNFQGRAGISHLFTLLLLLCIEATLTLRTSQVIQSGLAEGCGLSAERNLALSYNTAEMNQSYTIHI